MDRQYVGIDFHRRRSVIVRMSADGERLGLHRIVNDPLEFSNVIGLCDKVPAVVIAPCARRLRSLGRVVHVVLDAPITPVQHSRVRQVHRRADRDSHQYVAIGQAHPNSARLVIARATARTLSRAWH
jgi:hypothetical protein